MAAPDADAAWSEATRHCGTLRGYNAEVRPSGRVAGGPVRGVRLHIAVNDRDQIGVEVVAGTQTVLVLKGTADRAQLWLPDENRIVTAPASRILDALIGLNVTPGRLLAVLSGCVAVNRQIAEADRYGELVRLTTPDSAVFIERSDGAWQIRAGRFDTLEVEYPDPRAGVPTRVWIGTRADATPVVDLSLRMETIALNTALPPEAFQVTVPPDAVPAQVSDLRPLGSSE
jgi:hypothetical protein